MYDTGRAKIQQFNQPKQRIMVKTHTKCIVTYTKSAWLTGIVASLRAVPNLQVLQFSPQEMSAVQVSAISPDAVIVERDARRPKAMDTISSDVPVIEIDVVRSELTIRATNKISVTSVADLVRVIEQVTKREI